ncbi:unnamed protein product [Cuscuta campestris]|uniref:Uncharacterized protein n=1 Tax=Cuscuta campestris TaxID=132261 RepID=A0A484LHF3_9ASTE|nr:unnamed protein product [Cuscuta campestris]
MPLINAPLVEAIEDCDGTVLGALGEIALEKSHAIELHPEVNLTPLILRQRPRPQTVAIGNTYHDQWLRRLDWVMGRDGIINVYYLLLATERKDMTRRPCLIEEEEEEEEEED